MPTDDILMWMLMWLRTTVGVYANVNAEGELVDGDVVDVQSVSDQCLCRVEGVAERTTGVMVAAAGEEDEVMGGVIVVG